MKPGAISLFAVLLTLSLPSVCRAQTGADSLRTARAEAFRPSQLIAPGVLLASGTAIHCFAHESWDAAIGGALVGPESARGIKVDDYVQYVPLAGALTLDLMGVKAKHNFWDKTIEIALSHITLGIVSWSMKSLIDSPRPNGADNRSFPSGHSCFSFCGAELMRMEYGWGWGAGAYAIAGGVGYMRIYRNWHYFSDVLAGAGLGILCAHVGEWLLEPTKRLFGINTTAKSKKNGAELAVIPALNPLSGSSTAVVCLQF